MAASVVVRLLPRPTGPVVTRLVTQLADGQLGKWIANFMLQPAWAAVHMAVASPAASARGSLLRTLRFGTCLARRRSDP
jgi:hypothetical protein